MIVLDYTWYCIIIIIQLTVVPYIGNYSNVGAFANIFLYYFFSKNNWIIKSQTELLNLQTLTISISQKFSFANDSQYTVCYFWDMLKITYTELETRIRNWSAIHKLGRFLLASPLKCVINLSLQIGFPWKWLRLVAISSSVVHVRA